MMKLLLILFTLIATVFGSPTVTIVTPQSGQIINQGNSSTVITFVATFFGFTPNTPGQYYIYQNGVIVLSGTLLPITVNSVIVSYSSNAINFGLNLTGLFTVTFVIPNGGSNVSSSNTFTIAPPTPPTPTTTPPVIPYSPYFTPCNQWRGFNYDNCKIDICKKKNAKSTLTSKCH